MSYIHCEPTITQVEHHCKRWNGIISDRAAAPARRLWMSSLEIHGLESIFTVRQLTFGRSRVG
jgi:hypothetical protein